MEPAAYGSEFFVGRNEEELLAAIERKLGPEAAEARRQARRLMKQPRPLTETEQIELRANTEPVLRDIRAAGAIEPGIRAEAHEVPDPDTVCGWIQHPQSIGSMGLRVRLALPPAQRLADLADQLQEWEVEELAAAGRPATWPQCPSHPDSHPLSPGTHAGEAVWSCPASGQVVARIGALPPAS